VPGVFCQLMKCYINPRPVSPTFDGTLQPPSSIALSSDILFTVCSYVSVKRWQKKATLGADFGPLSTAPNPPL
jgi:hypothetical protein